MADLGWKHLDVADRAAILRGIADGKAYGGPYHVELHPADRCNIQCFFCSTAPLRETDQISATRLDELFAELKEAGTRSIRLAGGGEPLFHRGTKAYLRGLSRYGLPVENVTTNAVLLDEEVAEILVAGGCDEVTVSINTGDRDTYAEMMKTPARNFDLVVANVRRLTAVKRARRVTTPTVTVQFLVWKGNFRTIPAMYELARSMGADAILFNGISHLPAGQMLNAGEKNEMIALYEQVIRIDEYRTIRSIDSYEQDILPELDLVHARIHNERQQRGLFERVGRYLDQSQFTVADRLRHSLRMWRQRRVSEATEGMNESCVIGWHSMVIRATGSVSPCCILQAKTFGNIYKQSVKDIWYGPTYEQFRSELRDIMSAGPDWRYSPKRHATVVPQCAASGFGECPIRSHYYKSDVPFVRELDGAIASISASAGA
jgi:MoaA/NifB/PqqE/SkfB family radical SAM enzyme